jgi:hypothetical protein
MAARIIRHPDRNVRVYRAARRSASSSHAFTERMTSSLAGTPVGNSVCRSVSRSTRAVRGRLRDADGPRPLVALVAAVPRRVVPRCFAVAPATPCAWRRCAPRAAARPNVRPHSGHLNAVLALLARLFDLAPATFARARVLVTFFLGLAICLPLLTNWELSGQNPPAVGWEADLTWRMPSSPSAPSSSRSLTVYLGALRESGKAVTSLIIASIFS